MDDLNAKLARTRIKTTLTLEPIGNIVGDVAGVLGEALLELLGMFYPSNVAKKANIVITELVTNVVENVSHPDSEMQFALSIDGDTLIIEVTNKVTDEQYSNVSKRIDGINNSPDVRKMLAETIRARRVNRLKGGLGFMRLVTENKFKLSHARRDGLLTVRAEFSMKGLA